MISTLVLETRQQSAECTTNCQEREASGGHSDPRQGYVAIRVTSNVLLRPVAEPEMTITRIYVLVIQSHDMLPKGRYTPWKLNEQNTNVHVFAVR